ncbi:hypothetical protein Sjap_021953 [Stephania japonica]|uniref:50S ribosomal protein L18 n=1 Tax=Stephania japonica TaxID=461633 RepID=A0AAP0EMY1_9MAGN
MACISASITMSSSVLSSRRSSSSSNAAKPNSLSFAFSFPHFPTSPIDSIAPTSPPLTNGLVVHAAWTRRSRSEAKKRPNRKSWKQRTDMFMRPFLLNVFFSKRFIHVKVMHRGTSKVISVASTNAKDLRTSLPSHVDENACRKIGTLIAQRSMEADVFAMSYEPRKDERIEGKLGIILETVKENGIIFV